MGFGRLGELKKTLAAAADDFKLVHEFSFYLTLYKIEFDKM